ncbi:MAG: tRNA pseudouridine(55) synthase TruB [Kofleriaceae bacterium]
MDGLIVVDKPAGVSSALAVDRVKRALGATRAGHGGTLDPIATGVLLICVDQATKLAQYLLGDDKAYEAEGLLGVQTDSLDRTGKVTAERAVTATRDAMLRVLAARMGEQDQVPPMFSAIKQGGVRLYKHARAGEEVPRTARRIRIDQLELLVFEPPRFRIAITCSKGTYVRSVVADIGTALGDGAHMTELRRTRSGKFTIDQAVRLDQVAPGVPMIGLANLTSLPSVVAAPEMLGPIRSGLQLQAEALPVEKLEQFQIVDEQGRLVAIAHVGAGRIIYDRVFGVPVEA